MKGRIIRAIAAVAVAVTGLVVVDAPPAHASSKELIRTMNISGFGHSGWAKIWKETSTTKLSVEGSITTGYLPDATCVELYHNMDFDEHRSAELMVNCHSNTTQYFYETWMLKQDYNYNPPQAHGSNGVQLFNEITDPLRKGVQLCQVHQGQLQRNVPGQCVNTATYTSIWGNGTKSFTQPEAYEYNLNANGNVGVSWYHMVYGFTNGSGDGCDGCRRIRALWANNSFHHAVLGQVNYSPVTFSPWIGNTTTNTRFIYTFQEDGNLVRYRVNSNGTLTAVWSTGTSGAANPRIAFQTDGNLVIYDNSGCRWHSGTNGNVITRWENNQGTLYAVNSQGGIVLIGNGGNGYTC